MDFVSYLQDLLQPDPLPTTWLSALPTQLASLPLPALTQLTNVMLSSPALTGSSLTCTRSIVLFQAIERGLLYKLARLTEAAGTNWRAKRQLSAFCQAILQPAIAHTEAPLLSLVIASGLLSGLQATADQPGTSTSLRDEVEKQVMSVWVTVLEDRELREDGQ